MTRHYKAALRPVAAPHRTVQYSGVNDEGWSAFFNPIAPSSPLLRNVVEVVWMRVRPIQWLTMVSRLTPFIAEPRIEGLVTPASARSLTPDFLVRIRINVFFDCAVRPPCVTKSSNGKCSLYLVHAAQLSGCGIRPDMGSVDESSIPPQFVYKYIIIQCLLRRRDKLLRCP